MQACIWLLTYLPYLYWFGSLVNGAAVSTSPPSILQLPRLNSSNDRDEPWRDVTVTDKSRGAVLPAIKTFEACIGTIGRHLGMDDFDGFMSAESWSYYSNLLLGVDLGGEGMANQVQRGLVIVGIYKMLYQMKMENDFRSGVFEIQHLGTPACDIYITPRENSGFNNGLSLAGATQLARPPSSIAHNPSNSSVQGVASALGVVMISVLTQATLPLQPLDRLGMLISIVDLLVTAAQPPKDDSVQSHTSTVPYSGVTTAISPLTAAFTYEEIIDAAPRVGHTVSRTDLPWMPNAIKVTLSAGDDDVGVISMVPSDSTPPTSPRIEATVGASSGTATARKKRSMV